MSAMTLVKDDLQWLQKLVVFEGGWLEKWKMSWTHFPPETKCPRCGWYDLTPENIDQIAETSGGSETYFQLRLSAARCQCSPPHRVKVEQARLPYKED